MNFVVKQSAFEGPLDLLLSLIEKRKLFINDIALAKVTDDYIAYIEQHGFASLGDSAHFILIASTLLLIKSRSLLPTLTLTNEEEQGVQDLERRLKIYQEIKRASAFTKQLFGEQIIFAPSQDREMKPVFSPHSSMTLQNILQAVQGVLRSLPKKEALPQVVVQKVISLEEVIGNLTHRITKNLRMSFKEFSGIGKAEKVDVIVSFLAMLELVKQGVIHASQEHAASDIQMETQKIGVPIY